MGLRLWSRDDELDFRFGITQPMVNPNPNPNKFNILNAWNHDKYVLLEVKYDGCTNFEGIKLLLYKNINIEKLLNTNYLDPHFFTESNLIARFKPTLEGRHLAFQCMGIICAE